MRYLAPFVAPFGGDGATLTPATTKRRTPTMSRRQKTTFAALLVALSGALVAQPADATGAKPTVVLVHGAWADASGWNGVVSQLRRDGYPVIAPANPLRGLASDVAYLNSLLATVDGPSS